MPIGRCRIALEVIEGTRTRPGGPVDDDTPDHPSQFMGRTEVIVYALDDHLDLEGITRVDQVVGVPGLCPIRNAARMGIVARMIGRGRMDIGVDDPPYGGSDIHEQTDWIEPNVGAFFEASHADFHNGLRLRRESDEASCETGEH